MHTTSDDLKTLSLQELRTQWAEAWGQIPHNRIGRTMLERSLIYQMNDKIAHEYQKRLNKLVQAYKRNPNHFDQGHINLKPGMRLVRDWDGKKHSVIVTQDGFEYEGCAYNSLSKIANKITGSRWNGWLFFGLKKKAGK